MNTKIYKKWIPIIEDLEEMGFRKSINDETMYELNINHIFWIQYFGEDRFILLENNVYSSVGLLFNCNENLRSFIRCFKK